MKTLRFQFIAWARCFTEVEVPDDYEFVSDNPYEIWEDLQENYPDEIYQDIMDDDYGVPDYGSLEIDQMSLEFIDSVGVENEQGEEILVKRFEKFLFDR